jgi:hypothetical protein
MRVCVALEHTEEAVREEGWWGFEVPWLVVRVGGEEHAVAVENGVVGGEEWVLLSLKVGDV